MSQRGQITVCNCSTFSLRFKTLKFWYSVVVHVNNSKISYFKSLLCIILIQIYYNYITVNTTDTNITVMRNDTNITVMTADTTCNTCSTDITV